MAEVDIRPGVCMGFGGSKARVADCEGGDIYRFNSVETPREPNEFFGWMARNLLNAAYDGKEWLVAGFPGPVSADATLVGPLTNVDGMRKQKYNLKAELCAADPAVSDVINEGFTILAVNDGTLAAHAAASRIGEHKYKTTGAIIVGTGIGSGLVEKDPDYETVYRVDAKYPLEIGHLQLSPNSIVSFEDTYSGPGIERKYGIEAKFLPAKHPVWTEEAGAIASIALTLGLMTGVELVVPTGGVGAGASDKLAPHLGRIRESILFNGNVQQNGFMPEIMLVPPKECNEFEMYGGEGVIRDFITTI